MKNLKNLLFIFLLAFTFFNCKNEEKSDVANEDSYEETAEVKEEVKEEATDMDQHPDFSKELNLQDVKFNVSTSMDGGTNKLTVSTTGLPNEYNETMDIGSEMVTGAEVEDLNSDGSPELVVYAKGKDGNEKGSVYAYSVNNKKSMSGVYFPPTSDNGDINKGYQGHDEFTLVETSLVQRFPIFENGEKTGKIRQVQYKLQDGEASRTFVVASQTEFDQP